MSEFLLECEVERSNAVKVELKLETFTTVSFVVITKPLPFSNVKTIILYLIDKSVQVSTATSVNIRYKLVNFT